MDQGNSKDCILKLKCRGKSIIDYIASQQYRNTFAAELLRKGLIKDDVIPRSRNFAPNVVETDRVRVLFDAALAKVELNPRQLPKFLKVLKTIDADIIEVFIDRKLLGLHHDK